MSNPRGITEADLDRWTEVLRDIAYSHPHPDRWMEIASIADQLEKGPMRTWEYEYVDLKELDEDLRREE